MTVSRFHRQILLPEIGEQGQQRLQESTVFIAGLGGLGCPVALQLAACGVGHLILVDFDTVEMSNLHRQTLYSAADVGLQKAEVAAAFLSQRYPDTRCTAINAEYNARLALELVASADVLADCTDRLDTRYLTDDVCAFAGRPWSYASIDGFSIQWALFRPQQGFRYRQLFPTPPDPFTMRSCAVNGVLGAVAALAGTFQANDVLNHLLGLHPADNKVHHFQVQHTELYSLEIPPYTGEVAGSESMLATDYPGFCQNFTS